MDNYNLSQEAVHYAYLRERLEAAFPEADEESRCFRWWRRGADWKAA